MKKEVIYLLASTLLLVLAWIGFSVFDSYTTSTIPPAVSIQIAPIQPSFDTQVVNDIKLRIKAPPVFEMERVATKSAAPKITPTPTLPIATISATPAVLTPTASDSAALRGDSTLR